MQKKIQSVDLIKFTDYCAIGMIWLLRSLGNKQQEFKIKAIKCIFELNFVIACHIH